MLWSRTIITGIVILVTFAAGWTVNGWRMGEKIAKIRADHSDAIAKAQTQARETERRLQAKADQLRVEKNTQIDRLNRRVADLTSSLQNRPNRNDSTQDRSPAQGCSGGQLYREDAEFLVREAARADTIREAYKECSKLYEVVR